MKKRIIFCLGSNLGNREENLNRAIEDLILMLELSKIKKSNILQNKAMIPDNAPDSWNIDFLNIAISADINLDKFNALKILEICKKIEQKLGRKERERWAPREIDIDIAKIQNLEINIPKILIIPHPGIYDRDFFRKTILEIEEI
jgi:2-amino-4-hydroxy-6-hydroxymethyldihydropteridine diphosphokinase/dihydropteroate synthase